MDKPTQKPMTDIRRLVRGSGVQLETVAGRIALVPRHNMEMCLNIIIDLAALFVVLLGLYYFKIFPLEQTAMQSKAGGLISTTMDNALQGMTNDQACELQATAGPTLESLAYEYSQPDRVGAADNKFWFTIALGICGTLILTFTVAVLFLSRGAGVQLGPMLSTMSWEIGLRLILMLCIEGGLIVVTTFMTPAFLGVEPSTLSTSAVAAMKEDNSHAACLQFRNTNPYSAPATRP